MSASDPSASATSPMERLVQDVQDILTNVHDKQEYQKAIEKCNFLLNDTSKQPQSKKTAKFRSPLALARQEEQNEEEELESITAALYDIQAKCYLHSESYQELIDWINNTVPMERRGPLKPSMLYAKYRLGDYAAVLKDVKAERDDDATMELLSHLRAQSLYHSAETKAALQAYKDMYASSHQHDDPELKMEVLVNAIAVLTANSTPHVDAMLAHTKEWTDLAKKELNDDAADSSDLAFDLAYNLGTYHRIIGPGGSGTDSADAFLELAERLCRKSDEDTSRELAFIRTNRIWSRQWRGLETDASEYDTKDLTVFAAPRSISSINRALTSTSLTIPTASVDTAKWTPLQHRLYRYALAAASQLAGDAEGCRRSCQALRSSLGLTSMTTSAGEGKKKKKKSKAVGTDDMPNFPTSSPESGDLAWWESRIDVLLAHAMLLPSNAGGEEKEDEPDVSGAIKLLKSRLDDLKKQAASSITVDHAIAHVQLHLFYLNHGLDGNTPTTEQQIQLLESLPESIRSRKAVVATLTSLRAKGDGKSKSKSTDSDSSSAFLADVLFSQGEYQKAVDMYQEHLPKISSKPEELQQHARYVQALMHVDPMRANEHWMSIQSALGISVGDDNDEEDGVDGDALESTELPRRGTTTANSPAVSKLTEKMTTTDNNTSRRSHDAILRRRARKREEYISSLEIQGRYNVSHPTQPDPERWLPKYARSHNRRRKVQHHHKGAQGGLSISEKDILKLDAYARKGGNSNAASNGPSTANLKVVSESGGMIGRKGGRKR